MPERDRRSHSGDIGPHLGPIAPNMGPQSAAHSPADALFGKVRRGVLALLLGHPEESYHYREVTRLLGLGHGAVSRELRNLTEAGILLRERRGRQVYYRANPHSPIYPELRGLVLKTVGLADVLRAALAPLEPRIELAFVYGSMARGESAATSDVDVMVVGDVSLSEVVAALGGAQNALGREVNPSVYPPEEFRTRATEGQHFVATVLREPKIMLIGGQDDLARLAG